MHTWTALLIDCANLSSRKVRYDPQTPIDWWIYKSAHSRLKKRAVPTWRQCWLDTFLWTLSLFVPKKWARKNESVALAYTDTYTDRITCIHVSVCLCTCISNLYWPHAGSRFVELCMLRKFIVCIPLPENILVTRRKVHCKNAENAILDTRKSSEIKLFWNFSSFLFKYTAALENILHF